MERNRSRTSPYRSAEDQKICKPEAGVGSGMSGTDKRIPGTEAAERRSERIETKCLYTKKQKKRLPKEFLIFARLMGVSYRNITIREQKTRWGSCSSEKNLNFNWKLILAPPEVLDYVVVHELCHLKEMNHSKAFWDEVGKVMPEYETYKLWLKENGWKL